jgi:hypothetical protein
MSTELSDQPLESENCDYGNLYRGAAREGTRLLDERAGDADAN